MEPNKRQKRAIEDKDMERRGRSRDWYCRQRGARPLKLKRWLHANVGRPWDTVYSDYCKKVSTDTQRVFTDSSLNWLVNQNVYKEDGVFFDSEDRPVRSNFVVYNGVLLEIKGQSPKYQRKSDEARRAEHGVVWIDGVAYGRMEGIWYELKLSEYSGKATEYDQFMKCVYSAPSARKLLYGSEASYCGAKHQLSSTEIKRLKLNE